DDDQPDAPAPAAAVDDGKPGEGTDDGKPGDDTDDTPAQAAAGGDADGDGTPDAREDRDGDGTPDGTADSDGDGISDSNEQALAADVDVDAVDSDGDGTPDAQEDGDIDNDGIPDHLEEDPPTDPFDQDGDGTISEDEIAQRKEFAEFFADIPNEPDLAALEARPEDAELKPSMTVADFRTAVRIVKGIVLAKMAKKIAKKSDQRMAKFSWTVFGFSLLGILLLGMPLVLAKQYPGKGAMLLKYSALAAATFFVTVNLFGGVLFGLRTAQGALSNYTNPSIAIASGTFDTLHDHADDYVVMGKELFAPTLEQMRNHPDEQPAVLLLENGMKIVKDAKVFMSMAKLFKKVDFVFSVLPIILMIVTLVLFVLAIKPTLVEIVKLPAVAASGSASAGRDIVQKSLARVKGEMLATACTVGVLAVLTLVSSFVLGKIVGPALTALLGYFSAAVQYLQFVEGASSGLVFVTLFGVVLFLVLNLAALILSMSFFLGKSQKIFQQRFNEGEPIARHQRFFRWGIPSVLLIQVFPLLFVYVAQWGLAKINDHLLGNVVDAESVPWTKLLLAGPLFLVVAFALMFWAVRGFKAIKFLQGYKVKVKPRPTATSASAQPLPPL
nr:hypothetical protein [Myxococcota bacterium]